MGPQILPNDVLQEIIGALAQEQQRSELRTFLGMSSFCRTQAKKHIFSIINLGFGKQRSKAEFVSLFSGTDRPTSYVRELVILFTANDWTDNVVQTGLYNILPRLINLTSLHIMSTSGLEWTSCPPLSIRSAIRDSIQHLPLQELTICLLRRFPVEDLASLRNLRRLNVHNCLLTVSNTDRRYDRPTLIPRTINLEVLQLRRFSADTFLETIILPLLARNGKHAFLLSLSNLKSLDMDLCSPSNFESAIDLIKEHNIYGLEDLTINIHMDKWPGITAHNDCSEWLDQIILPQQPTLKNLRIETETFTANHDPFSGSFITLSQFGSDNTVETIQVVVRVRKDCIFTTGEAWCALASVLTNGDWKWLKEVKVSVVVLTCMRMHAELVEGLEALRETHLNPLLKQPFHFDYKVDVQQM